MAIVAPALAGPALILLVFAGEWFDPVLFEVLADGQTVGKRAVGIRVVHEDGTRIGWSASLLRNLLLAADWIPGTGALGLASMLASARFRRLGDRAAGTLVIHASPPRRSRARVSELPGDRRLRAAGRGEPHRRARHPPPAAARRGALHQLRDYRAGAVLRQIDWKATARLRRAISR